MRQKAARVVRGIGLQHRRVNDGGAVVRQGVEERRERLAEGEFHRVLINGLHFQIFREGLRRPLAELQQALKGEFDRLGGDRRAVGEFGVIRQGEGPLFLVVGRFPARRQIAFHLG